MPADEHPHSLSADDRLRLSRVEEGLAFTERAVEQLSAELADINRRVQVMSRRIVQIEQRLEKTKEGSVAPGEGPDGDSSPSEPGGP